ncbi:MAG: cyclase family protein [Solirubrobacteraceae bacterium]
MPEVTSAEEAVSTTSKRVSNWGRWGHADVLGTLNFIDGAKRRAASQAIRSGETLSLSIEYGLDGPQSGNIGRFNPVHTMTLTDQSSRSFPHGIGAADDLLVMPMQAATHWDGLGHIYDHGIAWNGRRASDVVNSDGDTVTGIERVTHAFASRAVLLDVASAVGNGELPDGYAITTEHLLQTIAIQGGTAHVGRGDIVLLRTGQLSRCRRDGWGQYAGGPAPGVSFETIDWIHDTEIAAIATDTWGAEVRPNEFPDAFQPWHQVVIPHLGLYVGEMFDLDTLAEACAADGNYDCLLIAAPLAVKGGVGAPVNPVAVR